MGNQATGFIKDKVLEECEDERLGKDDPGRHDDTSDESKVQIHELRGHFGLVELFSGDGIAGRAACQFIAIPCLHTVNVGPGRD